MALTSHLIKIFERVLRGVLVSHIEQNNLLPDGQHGSRHLAHWDVIIDGLVEGEGLDSVYLDFSKAFEKVETQKLRDSMVLGKVWLGKFLDSTQRQQSVAVEGRLSDLSPVNSGHRGESLAPSIPPAYILYCKRSVTKFNLVKLC